MSRFHAFPVNDLIEHDTSSDECVCGPDVEFVESGVVVLVHHALDGREHVEPDHDRAACPLCAP